MAVDSRDTLVRAIEPFTVLATLESLGFIFHIESIGGSRVL